MKHLFVLYMDPCFGHHIVIDFNPNDLREFKRLILDLLDPLLRMKPGFSIHLALVEGDTHD